MSKRLRQGRILELVAGGHPASQDELRRRLAHGGIRVTQATLSRDLKQLGVIKTPHGYALPAAGSEAGVPPTPPLAHLLKEFVRDIRAAMNLLVLKTSPGSAQPVAAALDSQQWGEVVGTVAGDDTILIITSNRSACQKVGSRIRELAA